MNFYFSYMPERIIEGNALEELEKIPQLISGYSVNCEKESVNFSKKILKNDGSFLSKLFMGANFKEIENNAKKSFKKVIKYKPISSRKESRELYIFCKNIIN